MLINFLGKLLPTLLKRVGKNIFYLVPAHLFRPARLFGTLEYMSSNFTGHYAPFLKMKY